jgi:hypothetical protein
VPKENEAEMIESALVKLRARREAWVKEEYAAVFAPHDLKKLTAEGLRAMLELALARGYCEGMAASNEVIRPESVKDAQDMLDRNPIVTTEAASSLKH